MESNEQISKIEAVEENLIKALGLFEEVMNLLPQQLTQENQEEPIKAKLSEAFKLISENKSDLSDVIKDIEFAI